MDAVLDILYRELCSNLSSPEEQEILKKEGDFLDEMERRLGYEDFSRFWDIMSDIGYCRATSDFRLGFWLGANLVLTAKSEPFPQN